MAERILYSESDWVPAVQVSVEEFLRFLDDTLVVLFFWVDGGWVTAYAPSLQLHLNVRIGRENAGRLVDLVKKYRGETYG